MILVRLMGGLGNQFFQYSAGFSLAKHLQTMLKLDVSWFNSGHKATPRSYALSPFPITAKIADETEIRQYNAPQQTWWRYFPRVYRVIHRKIVFEENTADYNPRLFSLNGDVYLKGYFASYRYFENNRSELLKQFSPKKELSRAAKEYKKRIAQAQNTVAIHIRRGDYAKDAKANAYHGLQPLSYYHQAMSIIKNRSRPELWVVFSDDISWCKRNFTNKKDNYSFIEHARDWEDLHLMSLCNHVITANSTFSWWGAWLNQHPDKIIVTPLKWFNNADRSTRDLIPPEWIRL